MLWQRRAAKRRRRENRPKALANGGQTIELSLPAELYDKIAKQEEAKLTSILTSVLAKKARVALKKEGIKHVKISRRPKQVTRTAAVGMKRIEKKCT